VGRLIVVIVLIFVVIFAIMWLVTGEQPCPWGPDVCL